MRLFYPLVTLQSLGITMMYNSHRVSNTCRDTRVGYPYMKSCFMKKDLFGSLFHQCSFAFGETLQTKLSMDLFIKADCVIRPQPTSAVSKNTFETYVRCKLNNHCCCFLSNDRVMRKSEHFVQQFSSELFQRARGKPRPNMQNKLWL